MMETARDRIMKAARRQANQVRLDESLEAVLGDDGLVYIMDGQTPRYAMPVEVFEKLLAEHDR
jgi:hypothetical protein